MDVRQFDAMIADAEVRLRRLRVLYDQWFSGVERIEPQQQRDAFERILKTLQREPTANTAVRFRVQQLQQTYTTYSTYWKRVTRQIEEGTYKRDVLRARRRREAREATESTSSREAIELDLDIELDMDAALDDALSTVMTPSALPPAQAASHAAPAGAETTVAMRAAGMGSSSPLASGVQAASVAAGGSQAVASAGMQVAAGTASRRFPRPTAAGGGNGAQARATGAAGVGGRVPPPAVSPVSHRPPPPQAPVARPAPPRAPAKKPAAAKARPEGFSEQQMRALYDRYIAARRKNAERTDNVRMETIEKSVRTMMPKLKQKHAGKRIDFEVVVRGGKVALKPIAK